MFLTACRAENSPPQIELYAAFVPLLRDAERKSLRKWMPRSTDG